MMTETLPVVRVENGAVRTNSRDVAALFEREHRTILRAYDRLECSPEFRLRNFVQTIEERPNPKGGAPIESRSIDMTRDGFTFLAMGFTGPKAARFKEAYIAAFNRMEAELTRPRLDGESLEAKVKLLELAERVSGAAAARSLWGALGLPPLAEDDATLRLTSRPLSPEADARASLRHLADFEINGTSVADLIGKALDAGSQSAYRTLEHAGIRVKLPEFPGEDGFVLWLRSNRLKHVFATTRWDRNGWADAIARLPGVTARLDQNSTSNRSGSRETLFVPLAALKDEPQGS